APTQQTGTQRRWTQLVIGIVCMAMVANLQYGWTLFVNPMHDKFGWTKAAIQVAFTIFVLCETWLVPVEGYLMDRFGPRPVVLVGGVLAGLSWIMNSYASTLGMLYFSAVIGGIGAGAVYGTCIGNALKWFTDKRGLAAGLTAAGFGAGAALTVIPITNMVKEGGYDKAFFNFGLIQGIVVVVLSLFLIRPPVAAIAAAVKGAVNPTTRRNIGPGEMLRTPVFWVLYVCMVLVASGGLMAAAEVGPIAKDYGVDKIPVTVLWATLPLLTMALSIDSLVNGLTRPLTGWISDLLGRENTMVLVFIVEGVAIWGLMRFGHSATGFLIFAPLIFLGYGEIFSLFPAASGDTFGPKYAATTNGLLYTAKGTSSLLIPLANVLKTSAGSWVPVLWIAGALPIIAALIAKFVLAPMRRDMLDKVAAESPTPGAAPGAHAQTT
ncbi:MAG: oxalate/formate MFS antiporter, partial [Gammaproteobacteria bacterium]|nr:oxalate/formate MFS antiporter [Gammaproteobacteria bacterium]